MMAENGLAELVVRAIADRSFRMKLVEKPSVIIEIDRDRFTLRPEEMRALTELKIEDWDAMTVRELDTRIKAAMECAGKEVREIIIKD